MKFYFLGLIFICGGLVHIFSQEMLTDSLTEVNIQSLRLDGVSQRSPVSVAVLNVDKIRDISQQNSLQDYISTVPGVFSLNANNFAQDLRISIRGFGARAAFGIRGIKLIVDGIPETTPDGQGQLDNLTLNTIDKIEIVKGSSSVLYGNASGGVIHIETEENVDKSNIEGGVVFGSYGLQQYNLKGGWSTDQTRLLLSGNHHKTNGYRDQSGMKSSSFGGKFIHDFKNEARLKLLFNYTNSPQADDPGGLNSDLVSENRRQARDRNIMFNTGEAISQTKIGSHFEMPLSENFDLTSYGFFSTRNFEGLLPFEFGGLIQLDRFYWGIGSSLQSTIIKNNAVYKSKIGFDVARQSDDRQRFRNLDGQQGDMTLSQIESFNNIGLYSLNQSSIGKWDFSLGFRWDNNSLFAEDRFLTNGDDSGDIKLSDLTLSLGANFSVSDQVSVYANFRESFETPSLSELSSNPSGTIGFNEDVKAQKAINSEIGLRHRFSHQSVFELTVFHIDTENDLVPFEVEEFPDRTFFRNAGSTNRTGIEVALQYQMTKALSLNANYAYSNFNYDEYTANGNELNGNQLPAIPKHYTSTILQFDNGKFQMQLQNRFIGELFTNDANSVVESGYQLLDFRCGANLEISGKTIIPFFGINNMTNTIYNDNIRINAFGSRFFEPGPERNFYGGLRFKFQ